MKIRSVPLEALAPLRGMLVGTVIHGLDETARNAWARNQAYIAPGNLVNSAALLGIDVCPMEGFDRAQHDEILGLKAQGLASTVIATIGYRLPLDKCADAAKLRFPNEEASVALTWFSQTNQKVGVHRHPLKTTTTHAKRVLCPPGATSNI